MSFSPKKRKELEEFKKQVRYVNFSNKVERREFFIAMPALFLDLPKEITFNLIISREEEQEAFR